MKKKVELNKRDLEIAELKSAIEQLKIQTDLQKKLLEGYGHKFVKVEEKKESSYNLLYKNYSEHVPSYIT